MTSQVSVGPPLWRWAVEGAEPEVGTEDDLIRQLASGSLPPYVLVWREGWGEWLPAMQVAELAEAFPEASAIGTRTARPSVVPGIPPVPISEYPRLRHLAKEAPCGWPDGFEGQEQEVITSDVPAAVLIEAARVMMQASPPRDLGLQQAIERASRVPPLAASFPWPSEERGTPPSGPALPLAAEFGLQGLLDQDAPRRSGASWLRAYGLWIALVAVGLGLAATFGLRALWPPTAAAPGGTQSSADTAQRALLASTTGLEPRQASSAAALPQAEPEPGCRFLHAPVSIDDWAVADVRPHINASSSRAIVIGYAQSHKSATGGLLDVESLRLTRRFWQQEERQIFSVTPLVASGKPSYHVERMGTAVSFGRALDTAPPLRIGMRNNGVVLGLLEQRAQRIWELPAGSRMSVPEVVSHPRGFTLAMRAAVGPGRVRVGLLGPRGEALSPLAELGSDEWDWGRPALASGPEQTLLAVTRRGNGEHADSLYLARAKNGELPAELVPFVPSDGDPELLAPVLSALPDGGFALMWSQGAGSRRLVRVQQLSESLEPRGPVFDVTSADPAFGGAMAGALHWAGDRLLAFYFLRRDDANSLWVCSLACGR